MSWMKRSHLLGLCASGVAMSLALAPRAARAGKQAPTRPTSRTAEAERAAELRRQVEQARTEAAALYNKGQYAEALPKLLSVLAAYRKLHDGRDHPEVAKALRDLGLCIWGLGRRAQSLKVLEAVVAMRKRIYGNRDHPDVADGLAHLGICLRDMGRPDEALPRLQAAVEMYRRIHRNRDRPEVAGALTHLGRCLYALGRMAEALPHFEAALVMNQRRHKGRDHPDVATCLGNVGHCLDLLGRPTEALPRCRAALAMRKRIYGSRPHPAVARAHKMVAPCLESLGRPEDALPHWEAALAIYRRIYKGRDHAAVAAGISSVASCLRSQARPAEGLAKHQEALAMYRRLYGDRDHPHVAASLTGAAVCLNNLGRSAEALPKCEAALAMRKRIYGDRDHADLANSFTILSYCLHGLGRPAEALAKCETALAMYRRLHKNPDHPMIARSLSNAACFLNDLGRPAEALPKCEAALAIRKRIHGSRDHPDVSASLNNLACSLHLLRRFGDALARYDAALAMRKRIYGDRDHVDVATSLNNLASCLNALGRPAEALPNYEAALAMLRRIHKGRDHPKVAAALNNVATCLDDVGRLAEALPKYEATLAMRRRIYKGSDHPDLAGSLSNLAYCLDCLRRPAEALPNYQAALAMFRKVHAGRDHPDVATSLNNVAGCLNALGRAAQALPKYQAAVAMGERLHSPGTFGWASNLGWLYLQDLDEPQRAAEAFEKAVAGMEQARVGVGGSDLDRAGYFGHIRRWRAFEGMIRAQFRLGRPAEALAYAERGRALGLRDVLERGARLHGGDLLGAVEAEARQRGDDALLRRAAAARKREREAFNRVAALTAQLNLLPGRADLTDALRARKLRTLTAELAEARGGHLSARRVVFSLAGAHAVHDIQPLTAGRIQRFVSPRHALLIYTVSRKEAMLVVVPPAGRTIRGFALRWPDGEPVNEAGLSRAVADYVAGMVCEGILARVADPQDVPEALLRARGVTRRALSRHAPAEHAARGYRLFRALIPAEIWAELRSAEQAYLVPDGALHRLPFETLIARKPKGKAPSARERQYWLDVGPPLIYGPSATVLVNRRRARDRQIERRAKGGGPQRLAVLLGDPVFERQGAARGREADGRPPAGGQAPDRSSQAAMADRGGYLSRYGKLRRLPGTRREVLRIYRTLIGEDYQKNAPGKSVAVLLGEDATRTRLFAHAPGSRYLHLATHGLADTSKAAIYSSLALTQPRVATPEDFGFLTLVDLFDHWRGRLRDAELVVLSACDTQRGRIEAGEGVFGISWGFLYAGAPAVIASLWQVSDDSTAEMMGKLYAAISRRQADRKGSVKLRAFVAVRKALRQKHPQPYFWAPFIYIGDPR